MLRCLDVFCRASFFVVLACVVIRITSLCSLPYFVFALFCVRRVTICCVSHCLVVHYSCVAWFRFAVFVLPCLLGLRSSWFALHFVVCSVLC